MVDALREEAVVEAAGAVAVVEVAVVEEVYE